MLLVVFVMLLLLFIELVHWMIMNAKREKRKFAFFFNFFFFFFSHFTFSCSFLFPLILLEIKSIAIRSLDLFRPNLTITLTHIACYQLGAMWASWKSAQQIDGRRRSLLLLLDWVSTRSTQINFISLTSEQNFRSSPASSLNWESSLCVVVVVVLVAAWRAIKRENEERKELERKREREKKVAPLELPVTCCLLPAVVRLHKLITYGQRWLECERMSKRAMICLLACWLSISCAFLARAIIR